jgi:ribosome-binding factor A
MTSPRSHATVIAHIAKREQGYRSLRRKPASILENREREGFNPADTMPKDRLRRVNEAMREVLSMAITNDLKDPRIGFVTVTAVDTSQDLRHAHVYVSVLGDDRTREETLAGLTSSHGFLQSRVASELHLKNTPQLDFRFDDTLERWLRIERLLRDGEDAGQ